MVSTRYSTVNMLRTIEDVLGIAAPQRLRRLPAADERRVRYDADDLELHRDAVGACSAAPLCPSPPRCSTGICCNRSLRPTHSASYWASFMKGFDFSVADHLDARATTASSGKA